MLRRFILALTFSIPGLLQAAPELQLEHQVIAVEEHGDEQRVTLLLRLENSGDENLSDLSIELNEQGLISLEHNWRRSEVHYRSLPIGGVKHRYVRITIEQDVEVLKQDKLLMFHSRAQGELTGKHAFLLTSQYREGQ